MMDRNRLLEVALNPGVDPGYEEFGPLVSELAKIQSIIGARREKKKFSNEQRLAGNYVNRLMGGKKATSLSKDEIIRALMARKMAAQEMMATPSLTPIQGPVDEFGPAYDRIRPLIDLQRRVDPGFGYE